jgi:hypothetical protein
MYLLLRTPLLERQLWQNMPLQWACGEQQGTQQFSRASPQQQAQHNLQHQNQQQLQLQLQPA